MDRYDDIGDYHRKISSSNGYAEIWVSRGLVQCYGFNHMEGVNCFKQALEYDPNCAMAYWGIAYAYGPHYNYIKVPADHALYCNEYTKLASSKKKFANEAECALIDALESRYTIPMPLEGEDLQVLLQNYSNEMSKVYKAFPNDYDIVGLYAESIMNLRPWNLWTPDGQPYKEALEAKEVLDKAVRKGPPHPLIYHLYIHLLELSPYMRSTEPQADLLMELCPGIGHLLHVPSHVYLQIGKYRKSIEVNLRAVAADANFIERSGRDNFYTKYRAHNYHFIMTSAMFIGDFETAFKAAKDIHSEIPYSLLRTLPEICEAFMSIYIHVLIRFGKWDDIIDDVIEEDKDLYPSKIAMQHYARSIAFAAKRMVSHAEIEKKKFFEAYERIPETRKLQNNSVREILKVAKAMSEGEILYRKGEFDEAFKYLEIAVNMSDNLLYDEPWGWPVPPRHALGALLLEQGRIEQAENVYKKDLEVYPNNIWALHGLEECLRKQEKIEEHKIVKAELERIKAINNIDVKCSCYCRLECF